MQVTCLELSDLRCFERAHFRPAPGLNLITGDNGAGKTSILEALHLMAYGRSFRGRVNDALIRNGAIALSVFVEWVQASGFERGSASSATAASTRARKAGLRHAGQSWEGRLDGAPVAHLGELCAALAVVTVEPGSHALITGGAENRRRFVDWGLFHVEPAFLALWRRYARALKQRNALLKNRTRDEQMDAWDHEMALTGKLITLHRQRYLEQLEPVLQGVLTSLLPTGGESVLLFQPGWRREELPLEDALLLSRERDYATGFTTVGPHRADWSIDLAAIPGRQALSRGQAKLTAMSALLAQAEHHAELRGEWPVVALDDLSAELDGFHQQRVLERLQACGAQVLITGTEPSHVLRQRRSELTVFHVEHSQIQPATARHHPP